MAYIYKIENKINHKKYIGKTNFLLEKRWFEHCKDYQKETKEKRPLYAAMKKYGIDNFFIELIEEIPELESSEREKYWIEYYKTFKYGYNATIGGDGVRYLDYDLVIVNYQELKNCKEVSKRMHIDVGSIRKILNLKDIEILSSNEVISIKFGKIVKMYSLQNEYLSTFKNMSEAAKFLIDSKISLGSKNSTRNKISEVCSGKRKTAYKYIWKSI